jgi:hypothetical protein
VAKQSRYEVARAGSPEALSEVSGEAGPKETQAKLIDLRRQMAELSSVYTPAHYKGERRIEAQIASLEASLPRNGPTYWPASPASIRRRSGGNVCWRPITPIRRGW